VIEAVAIDELNTRHQRLEAYQVQARYAVADSYDRALKEHASGGRRDASPACVRVALLLR